MLRIAKSENERNSNFNQQLINWIYSTVDLSKFKYEIIQFDNELPRLIKQKHYVSANFFGSSTLLVFTKIKDRYYTYTVERKTLSYTQNKIDYDKVKIDTRIKLRLDPSVYMGTIFDGTIVKQRNGETNFIITDVYYFAGQDFTQTSIDNKMFTLKKYLESNYNSNDKMNNMTLILNRLYEMKEIDHVVKSVIPSIKDFQIKGLCFYPEISGTKFIFLFGNETKEGLPPRTESLKIDHRMPNVQHKSSPTNENSDEKKMVKYKYINKTNKDIYATLEMKSTETVDVYNLFAVEKIERNGKKVLKRVKMGIAFVPSIEKSSWCKDIIEKSVDNSVLVTCKFDNDKGKWEPIEIEKINNRPTMIDLIETKLDLMEISDSD